MENTLQTHKIGKTIRHYREMLGFTQKELAERLGVTEKAVSSWEVNASTPRIGKLQMMSELFHVPITRLLMGGFDITEALTANYTEQLLMPSAPEVVPQLSDLDVIIEKTNSMNTQQLKRLMAYIEALLALRSGDEKDVIK